MAVIHSSILPRRRLAKWVWIASLTVSFMLLLVPVIFKLDGRPHADWEQFLGRFHPLIVHLPIGLVLLVPLLEVAGAHRPALREAAGFVLSLSVFACISAVALGYLLAYGSGAAGAGVTRHMWGGIALTIAVLLCALARPAWSDGKLRGSYPVMLAGVLLLLSWAAHQGGALTHGDKYLTEYLPAPLKHLTGLGKVQAQSAAGAADSFYARHIHPILDANCVACHGESKIKGGLRLDSYEALMRGGQEGAVIVPGQPEKSLLLQRVTLPMDHKLFMPADGKPPLKTDDIALLRAWIAQGASSTATSLTGVDVKEADVPPPPVPDYSAKLGEIVQTAKSEGVTVTQVSRNASDGLILNTIDASPGFTDAQLAKFENYAPYIVEVDLGRTSVTDASLDTLAKFSHLRALHLEDTAISGAGLQKLAPLSQLSYLNLSGTKVTEAAIAPLSAMKQLRHLYLFNTPARPEVSAPAARLEARRAS